LERIIIYHVQPAVTESFTLLRVELMPLSARKDLPRLCISNNREKFLRLKMLFHGIQRIFKVELDVRINGQFHIRPVMRRFHRIAIRNDISPQVLCIVYCAVLPAQNIVIGTLEPHLTRKLIAPPALFSVADEMRGKVAVRIETLRLGDEDDAGGSGFLQRLLLVIGKIPAFPSEFHLELLLFNP